MTKGVQLPETDSKVADLLWVDDVALFSTDEEELQTMLDTTDQTARGYRIEFGKEKSKVLRIGRSKKNETPPTFNLGPMGHSYLGETINAIGNIDDHIKSTILYAADTWNNNKEQTNQLNFIFSMMT